MAGSVCLLLWGSFSVRTAVEEGFSATLNKLLMKASTSAWFAIIGGVLAALLMQSATATILLATGFMAGGGMSIAAAVGVVIGADLGSAIATRVLFLDLSLLPPSLLVAGMLLYLASTTWRVRNIGRILLGLGIMLLAIQWMKQIIGPLAGSGIPADWLSVMHSAPWLAMLVMAGVTWFAHSSVAVILMLASLSQVGLLDSSLYIPMILGINIGAGLIALPLVDRRESDAHAVVLCNIALRTLLALIFLFLQFLWVEQHHQLASDAGSRVIVLHILFNTILVIAFAPLAGRLVRRIRSWLQRRDGNQTELLAKAAGEGLDPTLVTKPRLALACARREAFRLGDLTESMFSRALDMFRASDRAQILQLVTADKEINARNKAIHGYLSEVRRAISKPEQELELDQILHFSSTMENIGDTVSHDLARLATKRLDRGVFFSDEGYAEINRIHEEVLELLNTVINQFASGHAVKSRPIRKLVENIRSLCHESVSKHRRRLSDYKTASMGSSSIHQDAVRDLLQVALLLEHRPEDQ